MNRPAPDAPRPLAVSQQARDRLAPYVDPLDRGDALSAAPTRACAWPPCGRDFTPPRMISAYCSDACNRRASLWRKGRGAALVGPLLALTHARANRGDPAAQAEAAQAWKWILQRGRDLAAELAAAADPRP
jgi:hypothetical protein